MDQIYQIQERKQLIPVNLLKKDYNTTITDIESEMPSISGLATNSALTAVEKENITLATFSKYRLWWQNKRY